MDTPPARCQQPRSTGYAPGPTVPATATDGSLDLRGGSA